MRIGYARVSKEAQDTALQLDALYAAKCERIHQEHRSGADSTRPELRKVLQDLRPGDVLVVYKLDRLARSLADLLAILNDVEAADASFLSLTEVIDTSTPAGVMMMQMLGAFAQFERGMIRERTIAGVAAAVARGAILGRPRALTEPQAVELVDLHATGHWTKAALAHRYGCSISSVKRALYRAGDAGEATPAHLNLQVTKKAKARRRAGPSFVGATA